MSGAILDTGVYFVVVRAGDMAAITCYDKVRIPMPQLVGDDLWSVALPERVDCIRMTPVMKSGEWESEIDRVTLMSPEGR